MSEIDNDSTALAETVAAMERGVSAIAQATFTDGRWFGRADVLRRVERASRLGGWSYEVYDCKLASGDESRNNSPVVAIFRTLELVQGVLPESMYVVPPSEPFNPSNIGCWIMQRITAT